METNLVTVPPTRQLDYAPPPPWRQSAYLKLAVVTVCVMALGGAALRWAPRAWRQMEMLSAQRACASYQAPADSVIYTYKNGKTGSVARAWAEFGQAVDGRWRSFGTAYMHERRRPDGEPRLVFVDVVETQLICALGTTQPWNDRRLAVHLFRPGSIASWPREMSPAAASNDFTFDGAKTRIFAGQTDSSNPSHFTIAYASPHGPGLIDGYLHNDDSVTLEVRRPEAVGAK